MFEGLAKRGALLCEDGSLRGNLRLGFEDAAAQADKPVSTKLEEVDVDLPISQGVSGQIALVVNALQQCVLSLLESADIVEPMGYDPLLLVFALSAKPQECLKTECVSLGHIGFQLR